MRRDDKRLFEVILITALKTISAVLEAESRQNNHPVKYAKKYPDAIDVEYRVIEDGKQHR